MGLPLIKFQAQYSKYRDTVIVENYFFPLKDLPGPLVRNPKI